ERIPAGPDRAAACPHRAVRLGVAGGLRLPGVAVRLDLGRRGAHLRHVPGGGRGGEARHGAEPDSGLADRRRSPQGRRPLAAARAGGSAGPRRGRRPGPGAGAGRVGRHPRRPGRQRRPRRAERQPPERAHPAVPGRTPRAGGRRPPGSHRGRHRGAAGAGPSRVPRPLRVPEHRAHRGGAV
ncbi:MAG: hypothetical protein AVDCRST_MAG20-1622, partial [uncultured Acidimicrobiales bacterium]